MRLYWLKTASSAIQYAGFQLVALMKQRMLVAKQHLGLSPDTLLKLGLFFVNVYVWVTAPKQHTAPNRQRRQCNIADGFFKIKFSCSLNVLQTSVVLSKATWPDLTCKYRPSLRYPICIAINSAALDQSSLRLLHSKHNNSQYQCTSK